MFSKSQSKVLLLSAITLVITISQTCADEDSNHLHHQTGCRNNSDCGSGAGFICNTGSGECSCPGSGKQYVLVAQAKPQCQKIASIGESCNYNDQCNTPAGVAGPLSRCKNNKCECYDTRNNGRDVVRPYKGSCYRATARDEECDTDSQCKAWIQPEDHVKCFRNATEGKTVCRCIEGQHCEEKPNGAGTVVVGISSIATFAFLGLMATKVVL